MSHLPHRSAGGDRFKKSLQNFRNAGPVRSEGMGMERIIRQLLTWGGLLLLALVETAQSANQVLVLNQGGYVQVPSSRGLQNASAMTISGWIYPVENGVENPVFLSKGDLLNVDSDQSYWLGWSRLQGVKGRRLNFNLFLGTQTWASVVVDNVLSNSWTHFAITFDSTSGALKLFTNGVVASLRTVDASGNNSIKSLPVRQSSQPLVLGFIENNFYSNIKPAGAMDEIRIWSRSLSAQEILTDYRCGSLIDSSSEARWSFNTGTAIDDSGAGNNGVLGGGAGIGDWVGASLIQAKCDQPRATQAKATTVNGFVVGVEITDNGIGYQSPPQVFFLGGGGSGAAGVATVQNGVVTGVKITSTGSGYTSAPRVLVAAPPGVPTLSISVKQVQVRMNLILGFTYKLQSTKDLRTWADAGDPFLATESSMILSFDVDATGQVFRVVEVP